MKCVKLYQIKADVDRYFISVHGYAPNEYSKDGKKVIVVICFRPLLFGVN